MNPFFHSARSILVAIALLLVVVGYFAPVPLSVPVLLIAVALLIP